MAITSAYLLWRDRERWLGLLALGGAGALLVGASPAWLTEAFGRLLGLVGRLVPKDSIDWGVLIVIGAFVLLAAGARRSFVPRA